MAFSVQETQAFVCEADDVYNPGNESFPGSHSVGHEDELKVKSRGELVSHLI